jgi:hypothetical protein
VHDSSRREQGAREGRVDDDGDHAAPAAARARHHVGGEHGARAHRSAQRLRAAVTDVEPAWDRLLVLSIATPTTSTDRAPR